MSFKWMKCERCGRKYMDEEKHIEKYHDDLMAKTPIIPFEYYQQVRNLLRRSKLQVVKQKPELMVRVAPFIHREVILNDDITFEIGKTYIVKERE